MRTQTPCRKEPDALRPHVSEAAQERVGSKAGETVIPPGAPPMGTGALRKRWGVILAGGDGIRLKPLTQVICGDERPKQFCPLYDGKTLLAQTLRRAELTIPREQLLVSLNGEHCKWYLKESTLLPDQRIVQPANKGTAPPVAHSLLSISQIDEDAVTAILPSDHHYSDEPLFAAALESAFSSAAEHPDSVVLLGARPDHPETEYGWIELGSRVRRQPELFQVRGFQEKPTPEVARNLLSRGSIWNTFVMVGRVRAFLGMLQAALPDLMDRFRTARLWKGAETHIEYSLYQRMPAIDLAREVLSVESARLLAMRLGDVGWSDLGNPERALKTVTRRVRRHLAAYKAVACASP